MVISPMFLFSNRSYEYMKEPIKMHVEFSLSYKTLLIIEVRSKTCKAKGGAVQVLNIVDILSMTKIIDIRRLWLISLLQLHWNFYATLNFYASTKVCGKLCTCDNFDWSLHWCFCFCCCFDLCYAIINSND